MPDYLKNHGIQSSHTANVIIKWNYVKSKWLWKWYQFCVARDSKDLEPLSFPFLLFLSLDPATFKYKIAQYVQPTTNIRHNNTKDIPIQVRDKINMFVPTTISRSHKQCHEIRKRMWQKILEKGGKMIII